MGVRVTGSEGPRMNERKEWKAAGEERTKGFRGEGNGLWVWEANKDRCVQMEKVTGSAVSHLGVSWGKAGVTFSAAGLVEDIFLENHLLLCGGKCIIIIL